VTITTGYILLPTATVSTASLGGCGARNHRNRLALPSSWTSSVADPAESGPGRPPTHSMRENEAGIDMGILMECGNRAGFPQAGAASNWAPNLDLEASNPFEPMFAVRHALSQLGSGVEAGGVGSERSVSSRWWARRGRVGAPALRDQDACRGRAPSLPGWS